MPWDSKLKALVATTRLPPMTTSLTALVFVDPLSVKTKSRKTRRWPKYKSGRCFVARARVAAVDPRKLIAPGNGDVKNQNDTNMEYSKGEQSRPPRHHSHHALDRRSRTRSRFLKPVHLALIRPRPAISSTINQPPLTVAAVVAARAALVLGLTFPSITRPYTNSLSPQIVMIKPLISQATLKIIS